MTGRKWFVSVIAVSVIVLGAIALENYVIDPYFHYHKPLKGVTYRLYDERYTDDGILRNFEYDSIIIGTSMTQNFKTTEYEELFGGETVKIPLAGAGYQEISETLFRAFSYNNGIKRVLRGIDYGYLLQPYDYTNYEEYPEYLYDNNPWNDVEYLLNKDILYHGTIYNIIATLKGEATTTFNEYSSWERTTGKKAFEWYASSDKTVVNQGLSEEEQKQVRKTVEENIIKVAKDNPETEFLLFYTPYSILYWDKVQKDGDLVKQIQADEIATNMLTECPNIKLYSFFLNEELVTNIENYSDIGHYASKVNSLILKWISEDEGLITKENREEYINKMYDFYTSYDYTKFIEERIGD